MVSRPDEPIPGGLGPDEGAAPGAEGENGDVVPPFEVDTEKLRVKPDEEEPAGEDEPPPDERDN